MKLTRTWKDETYECPVPWGTSDSVEIFGRYAVTYNTSLDYFSVTCFNKEAWGEWFQELKSEALSLKKGDIMKAQECLHRLIDRGANDKRDDLWNTFFVQSTEDHAEDLLALVSKQHQEHYTKHGHIDAVAIVKDFPRRVLKMFIDADLI